ncbi:hypothetical protein [Brevibacillus porteri]|uniref:Uncharacterized protein n=1 Tax=Brevibacillus porteri TaxID=2126350 RepID=A0ABX5FFL4_9BACL|nr:hypothetical protein [Brevibacillus porteri]MED1802837.1 hypothetical protein [Brevibacillus porteri]MED2133303.1 hypothetical protein [Brevibacillus porteri]MED2748764.1 hypothetical protein [Brevibacillus porteri]MED2812534.1 hypothetical protein [Brevibacillus porteri]MED2895574.1 hypothetical protein [Brevibacillus porteri]
MWTKDEVVTSLMRGEIHKSTVAEFLNLEKPWNRYKREEFAALIAEEAPNNITLSSLLNNGRAKTELFEFYFRNENTLPPLVPSDGRKIDWVDRLQKYKESLEK